MTTLTRPPDPDPGSQTFFERLSKWVVRLTNELTFAPYLLNIEGAMLIAKKTKTTLQGSILGQLALLISNFINFNFTENKESHWYDFILNLYSKVVHFIQNILWEGLKKLLSLFGLNIDFSLADFQFFLVSLVVKGFVYYFTVPFGFNLFFETVLSSRSPFVKVFIAKIAIFLISLPFIDILSDSIIDFEIKHRLDFLEYSKFRSICNGDENGNVIVDRFIITKFFDFIVSLASFNVETIKEKYQNLTREFACFHRENHPYEYYDYNIDSNTNPQMPKR
jgi:hypothetical protein